MDAYVREVSARLEALGRARDRQADELRQLGEAFADLRARHEWLENATLDDRSQDVLDRAAQRARELVSSAELAAGEIIARARREAEVLDERARQEYAWRRRKLAAERAELAQQQRAARLAESGPVVAASPVDSPDAGTPVTEPGRTAGGRELSEQHS